MLVCINKNPDGSHTFLSDGRLDNGWAFVPSHIIIPSTFPFVNIEVAPVTHPPVTITRKYEIGGIPMEFTETVSEEYTQLEVVSMIAGEEIDIPEPSMPTQEERIALLEEALQMILTGVTE